MYQTQLTTTQLGHTGLEITRVGFGAWAVGGGGWEFGWGPQDDDESIAAIHHALAQTEANRVHLPVPGTRGEWRAGSQPGTIRSEVNGRIHSSGS